MVVVAMEKKITGAQQLMVKGEQRGLKWRGGEMGGGAAATSLSFAGT
jgi:hypothetical protein